jgi:hypothetical protein
MVIKLVQVVDGIAIAHNGRLYLRDVVELVEELKGNAPSLRLSRCHGSER